MNTNTVILMLVYNNTGLTFKFLENNLPFVEDYPLLIIDNGSSTEEETILKNYAASMGWDIWSLNSEKDDFYIVSKGNKHGRYLLLLKANTGYARGNNYGIKFIHSIIDCKYILICNNDVFWNRNIISVLEREIRKDPSLLMVAPQVKDMYSNKWDNPLKYEVNRSFATAIYRVFYPFSRVLRRFKSVILKQNGRTIIQTVPKGRKTGLIYVDLPNNYLLGCCLMLSYRNFKAIGFFDPNTFLGSEEIIISDKANKCNLTIAYTNEISVVHMRGDTRKKTLSSTQLLKVFEDSDLYYLQKYRNYPKWKLKFINFANIYFRSIWLPILLKLKGMILFCNKHK